MPFAFNAIELKVVTINCKPWAHAKEVCKALEYNKKTAHVIRAHRTRENYAQKYDLTSVTTAVTPVNWPKESQKYDLYINEEGMYEVLFGSQQQKTKVFRKYCCNEMFPHIRQQLTDKLVEEHHRRTTQLQQAVEEQDNRIQAIEYENVGLQGEITAYQAQLQVSQNRIAELVERYVDHCRNLSKDNIVIIVRKHTTPENDKYHNFPYYISRIQRRKRYVKLRWLD